MSELKQDMKLTKEIQQLEKNILIEFQRICERHNLRYFAIGGTCIGAIRHSGFIPWDDDIDVAMPYEDYKKFRDEFSKELPEPYEIFDIDNHKSCKHLSLKIHNVETAFIEENFSGCKDRYTGVFVDIMPVYGMPDMDAREEQKFIDHYIHLVRSNRTRRSGLWAQKGCKRKIYWLANAYKRGKYPYNYYSRKIEALLGKNSFGCGEKVIFGWRSDRKRAVFFYEDFRDTIMVPFEDIQIAVPKGYDRYLTMDFGDYMTLPPVEKQVTVHPTALIDLNNSYKKIG